MEPPRAVEEQAGALGHDRPITEHVSEGAALCARRMAAPDRLLQLLRIAEQNE